MNSTNISTKKIRTYIVKKKINSIKNEGTSNSNASSNIVSNFFDK
jgi:hypothetical protein